MVLYNEIEQHGCFFFNTRVEVVAFPGLIDLADAAMEGCILFQTEQFAATELLFQALDGFDGIFICGVETLGGRCVCDFEALVIVGIQGV